MLRLLLITFLVTVSLGAHLQRQAPLQNGRIVGGRPTTIEEHPYQVSLQYVASHICGASIIAEDKILTAAHCTEKKLVNKFTVRAGSSTKNRGDLFFPSSICQHPQYDPLVINYDVSVLTLMRKIEFGPTMRPIPLHPRNAVVPDGVFGVVTGWGRLDEATTAPSLMQLQAVELPKIGDGKCNEMYGELGFEITEQMFCFGYEGGGKDSCQGDSGDRWSLMGRRLGSFLGGSGALDRKGPAFIQDWPICLITSRVVCNFC